MINITNTYLPPLEEGVPYPLFVQSGLVPWRDLARALTESSSSDDHSSSELTARESRVRESLQNALSADTRRCANAVHR